LWFYFVIFCFLLFLKTANGVQGSISTTDYADDTDFKGIAAASRRFSGISQIRQAAFRDFTDSAGGFQTR